MDHTVHREAVVVCTGDIATGLTLYGPFRNNTFADAWITKQNTTLQRTYTKLPLRLVEGMM